MKKTIIYPPSTFLPYLHSRSFAVSHHCFLPPSHPLLPPSIPPSIPPRPFPVSHHRFLPPSRPLLPPSLPPSILPLSFPAPRCPPASCRATQYTPCVYTVLVSCTGYCVGSAQPGGVTQPGVALRQWSGRAISRWLAVTLANGVARIFFGGGASRYIFVTSPGADRIQWGGGVVAVIFRDLNYRIGFSGGGGGG